MAYRITGVNQRPKKMMIVMAVLLAGTCLVSPATASLNEMDWDDMMPECCCGSALLPMACAGLRMRLTLRRFLKSFQGILPINEKPTSAS